MSDYLGDFTLGSTFDVKFTTVNTKGVPTTLAGTPVISAYPDNSLTEITAGITLTVGFDSRTGMHNVNVVATAGNGYAAGSNYALVITTGTVAGTSVVGYPVAHFSIEARSALRPTAANRTLTIESDGMAHADVKEWLGAAPDALSSGKVPTDVKLWAATATAATDIALKDTLAKTTDITGFNDLSAAQVNAEADTALADVNLDHLVGTATGIPAIVAGTYVDQMMDDGAAVYDRTTNSLQAIRDRGDAAWTGGLDAAGVRSAIGLAAANLDTQLSTIDDFLDTEIAAIKAKTDQLTFTIANKLDASIQAAGDFAQGAADKVWLSVIEGTITAVQWARIILAAISGKSSKVGNVFKYRDVADTKDRLDVTTDGAGSRTTITTRDGT